jgi:hypothetical protein
LHDKDDKEVVAKDFFVDGVGRSRKIPAWKTSWVCTEFSHDEEDEEDEEDDDNEGIFADTEETEFSNEQVNTTTPRAEHAATEKSMELVIQY